MQRSCGAAAGWGQPLQSSVTSLPGLAAWADAAVGRLAALSAAPAGAAAAGLLPGLAEAGLAAPVGARLGHHRHPLPVPKVRCISYSIFLFLSFQQLILPSDFSLYFQLPHRVVVVQGLLAVECIFQ